LPTLLVFSASSAGPAAPQQLAYQEIARSAVDTEILETGPRRGRNVEPDPSRPPALGRGGLCSAHVSALSAQFCTIEKFPVMRRPRITITNHYHLEEIGFDPKTVCNPPQPVCIPTAGSVCRCPAPAQTAPPKIPISGRTGSSFFRCTPRLPGRLTHKGCTNPKPLPLAALRIIKGKDSHLSKIGFLPQKTSPASAD
jgi:hypothetical protein